MGMFDSVRLTCAYCEEKFLLQDKSGVCELREYPEHAVPPEIAASITNQVVTCDHCGHENVIVSALAQSVPCFTRKLSSEDDVFQGKIL